MVRQEQLKGIRKAVIEKLSEDYAENDIRGIIQHLEYRIVRNAILDESGYPLKAGLFKVNFLLPVNP